MNLRGISKVEPDKTNFNETKLKKLTEPEDYLYKKEHIQ